MNEAIEAVLSLALAPLRTRLARMDNTLLSQQAGLAAARTWSASLNTRIEALEATAKQIDTRLDDLDLALSNLNDRLVATVEHDRLKAQDRLTSHELRICELEKADHPARLG